MAATDPDGPGVRVDDGPGIAVPWPSTGPTDTRVPIAFFGTGFAGRDPADGTGLDQIAPTLAAAMGFDRSHDEVRAGVPAQGVADASDEPSLVVQVVWKGVGSADLEAHPHAWPFLRATIARGGGTLEGTTGSLPLDRTATLTTIGTGGLPTQHGITGTIIRGDDSDVAQCLGAGRSRIGDRDAGRRLRPRHRSARDDRRRAEWPFGPGHHRRRLVRGPPRPRHASS